MGHQIPARIPCERCTCEVHGNAVRRAARGNAARAKPHAPESPLAAYAEGYKKDGRIAATVREDFLRDNPFDKIDKRDKIREPESKREFLTIDEVKLMMKTPFPNKRLKDIKNAYLFSCFCGLRISDIIGLKWKNVYIDNGQYRLEVVMQKTKEPIYLPLSQEALRWMPEWGEKTAEGHVFDLPSPTYINVILKPWAKVVLTDMYH